MKFCLHQFVMPASQLGIVVGAIGLSGGPDGGVVLCGTLLATMAAATVIGLLDLSRRLLRWSVAALYAVAFATIYHFAWSDETRAPTLIIFGIVIGIYGCLLVACSVASVRRAANMKGDKAREPIFGPRAPEFAFKVLCQLAAGFLSM
jgi:hypothetical protein